MMAKMSKFKTLVGEYKTLHLKQDKVALAEQKLLWKQGDLLSFQSVTC